MYHFNLICLLAFGFALTSSVSKAVPHDVPVRHVKCTVSASPALPLKGSYEKEFEGLAHKNSIHPIDENFEMLVGGQRMRLKIFSSIVFKSNKSNSDYFFAYVAKRNTTKKETTILTLESNLADKGGLASASVYNPVIPGYGIAKQMHLYCTIGEKEEL